MAEPDFADKGVARIMRFENIALKISAAMVGRYIAFGNMQDHLQSVGPKAGRDKEFDAGNRIAVLVDANPVVGNQI